MIDLEQRLLHVSRSENESIKSSNDDIPGVFNEVKNVPSVFTVNSFNFTTSDPVMKNCDCKVDKNAIRKTSKICS